MKIHTINKKYSLISAALLFGLSAGQAAADGTDCVGIASDLARLQCFDAAYEGSARPVLSPQEAVQSLIDITSYHGPDEFVKIITLSNPCHIQANSVVLSGRDIRRVYISRNDLSTVERVGEWGPYDDRLGLQLFNERGADGYFSYNTGTLTAMINFLDVVVPSELIGMREFQTYNGRDIKFHLLATNYRPDTALIRDAMVAAVEACQSQ